ncbi:UNKNOWN [Stylonychia lemnae]|uniref:Uncharacterized protein n=1 Tax=Stylonychia lemnae TaxID=5949 RepID=A0A077ZVZ9_STYLE|nr:UNKNOWN [Stylonychia lemnae]|eukprot:CDW73766.1 UNKNOWN [Stylonychia lemnae]
MQGDFIVKKPKEKGPYPSKGYIFQRLSEKRNSNVKLSSIRVNYLIKTNIYIKDQQTSPPPLKGGVIDHQHQQQISKLQNNSFQIKVGNNSLDEQIYSSNLQLDLHCIQLKCSSVVDLNSVKLTGQKYNQPSQFTNVHALNKRQKKRIEIHLFKNSTFFLVIHLCSTFTFFDQHSKYRVSYLHQQLASQSPDTIILYKPSLKQEQLLEYHSPLLMGAYGLLIVLIRLLDWTIDMHGQDLLSQIPLMTLPIAHSFDKKRDAITRLQQKEALDSLAKVVVKKATAKHKSRLGAKAYAQRLIWKYQELSLVLSIADNSLERRKVEVSGIHLRRLQQGGIRINCSPSMSFCQFEIILCPFHFSLVFPIVIDIAIKLRIPAVVVNFALYEGQTLGRLCD